MGSLEAAEDAMGEVSIEDITQIAFPKRQEQPIMNRLGVGETDWYRRQQSILRLRETCVTKLEKNWRWPKGPWPSK